MTESQPELVDVDPARAAELLGNMWPSRQPKARHVQQLAAAMRETATWDPSGREVTVDRDGRLVAGQHELTAVMEVGRPVPLYLVTRQTPGYPTAAEFPGGH